MRKILNLLALGFVITGLVFQSCNCMLGSIALILSAVTMLSSLLMFSVKDNRVAGLSNWLNYFLVGIVALLIIGTTMKLFHWPGAMFLLMPAFGLLPIALIALIFQKDEVKISKQFFITSSIFFIFLLGMISIKSCSTSQCDSEQRTEACCKKGQAKDGCSMMMKGQCDKDATKKACCKKGTAQEGKCKMGAAKKDCCKKGTASEGQCKDGTTKKACCNKGTAQEGECKNGAAKKDCCKKGTVEEGHCKEKVEKKACCKKKATKDEK